MKILKFKKTSKDKYKLFLDNNEVITLYEDVIIDNNLLIKKEIDNDTLNNLMNQNNDVYAYNVALNYISIKMRSIKEIKEYLIKKGFSTLIINKIIDKLINNGYLNDVNFTKAFINDQINLSTKGPYKIRKELVKYGVDESIIESEISNIDNNIIKEKLSGLIKKQVKIKKGSVNSLKLKLVSYFTNLGYDKQLVLDELSNYDLSSDINLLQKDFDKLYSKYKDKYTGTKLDYFIAQKLYLKGYTSDDITNIIKKNSSL